MSNLGASCQLAIAITAANAQVYNVMANNAAQAANGPGTFSFQPPNQPSNSTLASVMNALYQPLVTAIENTMKTVHTKDPRGPVASLAVVGGDLLAAAENIWLALMLAAFLAISLICYGFLGLGMFSGLCVGVIMAVLILAPLAMVIIALLWGIGILIGIYLPLVPYLVYTFTSITWFVLVIETIVAAPIVALALVSPAGEQLGRAGQALVLIANVVLRPGLMVIAFILSIKLVNAVLDMLNFGFFQTVSASIQYIGIMGIIIICYLYAAVSLALIQECFSLIHILPDRVIRWIGGHPESTSAHVKSFLDEAKKSTEEGFKTSSKYMKEITTGALEKVKETSGKIASKAEKVMDQSADSKTSPKKRPRRGTLPPSSKGGQ